MSPGGKLSPEQKATIYREHDREELLKAILSVAEIRTDLFIKIRNRKHLQTSLQILRTAEHYLLKEYEKLYGD